MSTLLQYGLVGQTLAHSHSPAIHAAFGSYPYALYEVSAKDLPAFLRKGTWGGLNVTIPYKQTVLPLCDALTEKAGRIGSVNTLLYGKDGAILGDNTDYDGFLAMADSLGASLAEKKVLILGSGGTARTVRQAVLDRGAQEAIMVSRQGPVHYGNLSSHSDADILVNATPVGMFPQNGHAPLSLKSFTGLQAVMDVVYNPLRTALVLQAQSLGIPACGGLSMLVHQAAHASALFLRDTAPLAKAGQVLAAMEKKLTNIVLIGMPGCGKTTVGAALAQRLGRPFFDSDVLITQQTGHTPAEIIRRQGEAFFRSIETEIICEMSKKNGAVLATGGGSILAAKNRIALQQNGWLVHLQRPLALLSQHDRPLSVNLAQLAAVRMPLYHAASDVCVQNDRTVMETAACIEKTFA